MSPGAARSMAMVGDLEFQMEGFEELHFFSWGAAISATSAGARCIALNAYILWYYDRRGDSEEEAASMMRDT